MSLKKKLKDVINGLKPPVPLKEIRWDARFRDYLGKLILGGLALTSVLVVVFIFLFLWFESIPAFVDQGIGLLWDAVWNPNIDRYGILTFIAGTMWTSGLAILLAVPLGLFSAVFLAEYCPPRIHRILRTMIELMAAIPSIVFGLWAFYILVPILREFWQPLLQNIFWWNPLFAGNINGYGILPGAIILAVMLLPTVVAISEDAINFVPKSYREASLALGASRTETAFKVVISTALPGIGAAVLLALGRAVGETMAVLMVTGNALNIPDSFFDTVYVMTSLIANQLGFAYNTPLYRSGIFTAALILLIMSIGFTILAKVILRWSAKKRGIPL